MKTLKRVVFFVLATLGLLLVVFFVFRFFQGQERLFKGRKIIEPSVEVVKPLVKYTFESLRARTYPGSEIKLEKVLKKEIGYTSYLFSYLSDGQRVTGMANLPVGTRPAQGWPVVVMLRGHVDDEVYFTGAGTHKAAAVFSQNGFLTLAPDFLGFGGSDPSSDDILEARFSRPLTTLNLLASLKNLEQADTDNVFLWGHSNGGQVALSVLEISQENWPTTLWAPVTLGFPESILTYIQEMDDQGKMVTERLNRFQSNYDVKKYSIDNYFADIQAPIQIHQGLADYLIKPEWTKKFVTTLKSLGKEVSLRTYSRADHNLKQNWDLVVQRDIQFFRKHLTLFSP